MKALSSLILLLGASCLESCGENSQPEPRQARCTVIDGDTLRCYSMTGGFHFRLRLNGINAPELYTAAGLDSAVNLREAFPAERTVTYYPLKEDRYGRTVAEVFLGSVDLSCYQLADGQAKYVPDWDEQQIVKERCL